ncbi:MAG: hypothetical protein LBQ12_06335, partial [Deltaproteobacteria bacterium]|nr:hypothetical protein [Deltaproteobacteria bacterium]
MDEKDGYFEGGPPGGEALDGLSLPRDGGDADGYEGGFSGGRGGEARGYEARETSGYDSDGGDSYEGRDARIHEGGDSYEGRDASGYSYDGGDADADEGGLEGFATLDEAPKGFAGYGAHGDGWESREPSKGPKRARVPEGGSRRGEGQDAAWTEGSDAEVPGSSEGEIDSKGTEGSGSSKEAGNPADPDDPREKHGSLFWHSYPETPPDEFSIKNLRGRAVAGIIPFRRGAVAPGPGELPPRSRAGGPEGTRIPPETPWGRPFGLGGPAPGRKDPSGGGSIGAGTDPEGPPQDAPARSDGEKAAHDPADDWEAFPSDPPPPPLAGWPSVGPGPHIRRSKGRPALMNVLTAALLVPVIAVWVASGALSPWCLAPLVLAPLAAFLLRSANPPALGSFVWLKGTLAGLAVLPAVWHPQPAAFFWHFSPSFLLAGTGAALGGALAAAKPGLLRSPLAPAALLAALLPFAAGWASGLSGPEPEPPPDILLFGGAVGGGPDHSRARGPAGAADWRSGGSSDGSGAFPDGARGADGRSASGYAGAPPAAAWELSGAPAPSGRGNPPAGYPPAAGYASLAGGPAPAGRPPAGRDPGATELAALLALAPLFLFLMARGEAPRLPAMVFLSGLAALAMLKGSVDWGAGVFWSMAAFMVLPELLRGPRRALLGLLLWAPAACEIAASYGW